MALPVLLAAAPLAKRALKAARARGLGGQLLGAVGLGPGGAPVKRRRRRFLTAREKDDLMWVKTALGRTAAAEALALIRSRR